MPSGSAIVTSVAPERLSARLIEGASALAGVGLSICRAYDRDVGEVLRDRPHLRRRARSANVMVDWRTEIAATIARTSSDDHELQDEELPGECQPLPAR